MQPKVTITLPKQASQSARWRTSSVLRPSIPVRKNLSCMRKEKNKKRRWIKPQEELPRRGPSPRTDRHAVDVACTERNNRITVYKLIKLVKHLKSVEQGDDLPRATRPPLHHSDPEDTR